MLISSNSLLDNKGEEWFEAGSSFFSEPDP